jgi:hypothetical protein
MTQPEDFDPLDTRAHDAAKAHDAEVQRARREQWENDFRWLMAQAAGRRLVCSWLRDAGVFRTSFTPDALVTAFNEGNRNIGIKLLDEMHKLCPARYAQMMKEHQDDERRYNRADRDH